MACGKDKCSLEMTLWSVEMTTFSNCNFFTSMRPFFKKLDISLIMNIIYIGMLSLTLVWCWKYSTLCLILCLIVEYYGLIYSVKCSPFLTYDYNHLMKYTFLRLYHFRAHIIFLCVGILTFILNTISQLKFHPYFTLASKTSCSFHSKWSLQND